MKRSSDCRVDFHDSGIETLFRKRKATRESIWDAMPSSWLLVSLREKRLLRISSWYVFSCSSIFSFCRALLSRAWISALLRLMVSSYNPRNLSRTPRSSSASLPNIRLFCVYRDDIHINDLQDHAEASFRLLQMQQVFLHRFPIK
jgi:hypothetical protein